MLLILIKLNLNQQFADNKTKSPTTFLFYLSNFWRSGGCSWAAQHIFTPCNPPGFQRSQRIKGSARLIAKKTADIPPTPLSRWHAFSPSLLQSLPLFPGFSRGASNWALPYTSESARRRQPQNLPAALLHESQQPKHSRTQQWKIFLAHTTAHVKANRPPTQPLAKVWSPWKKISSALKILSWTFCSGRNFIVDQFLLWVSEWVSEWILVALVGSGNICLYCWVTNCTVLVNVSSACWWLYRICKSAHLCSVPDALSFRW